MAAAPEASPSSLEATLSFWRAFDLAAKRAALEAQGAEIVAKQDASAEARKRLADTVRAWKRDGTPAGGVLKEFQEEIDTLTRRARAAERSFLGLFKELAEAPDPATALTLALDRSRLLPRLQEENARLAADVIEARAAGAGSASDVRAERDALRAEVSALEVELSKLANQDITIRQLESRIELVEAGIESAVAERLAVRESDMRRVVEAELEAVREAETAAEGRVSALAAQLADAAAARDEAQAALFSTRARAEDELASRSAEADELAGEVERLRGALAGAAAQGEDLRRRLAAAGASAEGSAAAGGSSGEGNDPFAALRSSVEAHRSRAEAAEEETVRLSASLTALQDESKRWGEVLEARRLLHESILRDALQRGDAKEADAASLRAELAARPSGAEVSHLRHQLRLLQAMHFNAGEEEGGGEGDVAGEGMSPTEGGGLSLPPSSSDAEVTTLMLRRIRQLEARAVRAESARADTEGALVVARTEGDALREQLADSRDLCARLEDTLADTRLGGGLRGGGVNDAPPGGGAPSDDSPRKGAPPPPSASASADAQLTSILLSAATGAAAPRYDLSSAMSPGPATSSAASSTSTDLGDAAGLTLALRGQRDRFRTRMLALEGEVQARHSEVSEAHARVAKLTADNVQLYEKIRFLQSFIAGGADGGEGGSGTTSGGGVRSGGGGGTSELRSRVPFSLTGEDESVDGAYRKLYQDSLDPFADFSRRERARQYAKLTPAEKITLRGTRFFLGSQAARTFLLCYAAALHVLVFFVVWHFLHSVHDCEAHTSMGGGGGRGRFGVPRGQNLGGE